MVLDFSGLDLVLLFGFVLTCTWFGLVLTCNFGGLVLTCCYFGLELVKFAKSFLLYVS